MNRRAMHPVEKEGLENFYRQAIATEFETLYCIARRDSVDKMEEALKQATTNIEWLRVTFLRISEIIEREARNVRRPDGDL